MIDHVSFMLYLIDLKALLTPEAVTELVMESMYRLPHSIPKTFQHSYTPIAAAGTDAQVFIHYYYY